MGHANASLDLLPGILDLLILKTPAAGPQHGDGIAQPLKQLADEVLQVGESSLCPALQRLALKGWARADWGVSEQPARAFLSAAPLDAPARGRRLCSWRSACRWASPARW